jgi:hypothetical protein
VSENQSTNQTRRRSERLLDRAVISVVLGVVGIGAFGVTGPLALYLGYREWHDIQIGRKSPENRNVARAGVILGLVDLLIFIIFFVSVMLLTHSRSLRAMFGINH